MTVAPKTLTMPSTVCSAGRPLVVLSDERTRAQWSGDDHGVDTHAATSASATSGSSGLTR